MPTAEQIKALIKTHYECNTEKFATVTLQIAAHEAKLGHINLADDIKKIIDKSRFEKQNISPINQDFQGLIIEAYPNEKLSDLVLSDKIIERIKRIEKEFVQKDKLRRYNLSNRRKLLFSGPAGTGKTMTAFVIAHELNLPLNIILMDKVVTKFMGETSVKLRQVFDIINKYNGVYLFDEFDAIGAERAKDNDVGEMRRVLNSFLQFIEKDNSNSIIIAATNNIKLLDQALFRRFDDVLHYQLPTNDEKIKLIKNKLGSFLGNYDITCIADIIGELSHAEITKACCDSVKEAILSDKQTVSKDLLMKMIEEKKSVYTKTR